MDPNETLRLLRALLRSYRAERVAGEDQEALETADQIYEQMRALDVRLTSGGFKPDVWEKT